MIIKQIPNILTSLNLLTGCIGITLVFSGNYHLASICILLSALLDYLDGLFAKLLNAQSSFGKEFDSLSDIVSFGVLPASIIFAYMNNTDYIQSSGSLQLPAYMAYFTTLFSAIRLAKFNTDKSQQNSFIGLPTPANAILISSIPLILEYGVKEHYLYDLIYYVSENYTALFVLTLISSFLLVSPVRMLSLKFKSYNLITNRLKYVIILFAIFALTIFGIMAIPIIIIFYILLSALNMVLKIDKAE